MSKRRRASPRRASAEAPTARPPRDSFRSEAIGIFGCALVIRLLHLWQLRTAPFFPLVIGDGDRYDAWARTIAAGDWMGGEVFSDAPLYAYFLGAIYASVGDDPTVVGISQALVGALSCVLLGAAGWRLFSKRIGLVAGLLSALCAPAIFSGARIEPSVLVFFFLSAVVWLLSGPEEGPQKRLSWIWTGFALGCLILTRGDTLTFVVAILVWLAVEGRALAKQRLVLAAMLLIGLGAVLLPVAARNLMIEGELGLTTSQFGTNFYIGNNTRADGTYPTLGDGRGNATFEREDATRRAEQAIGRP